MDRLIRGLGAFVALGFLVIVAMMVYEVVARYLFNAPTFWAHEIAGMLAAFAFLIGGAYCMVEHAHMRITLLADQARPRLRRLFALIGLVCGLVYLGGLTYSAWTLTERSLFRFTPDGLWFPERSGTSWNTPMPAFIKAMLFVSSALFLAVIVRQLFQLLRGKTSTPGAGGEAG